MSRAIFLSWVFLITAFTFDTAFAQTNAHEGGREAEADALYSKAEARYGEGKLEEAASFYKEAALRAPDDARAYCGLCVSRAKLGDYESAEPACRRAAGLESGSPRQHTNLGRVLRSLGREDEAVAELRRAVELKSDFADAHASLGEAYTEMGRYDEAARSLGEAVR